MGEKSASRIHVVHVIGSLVPGGAELVLTRLLESMDQSEFPSSVISLTDSSGLGSRIRAAGVPVYELGISRKMIGAGGIFRLYKLLRELQPEVVHSWLYHSNFLVSLLTLLLGGARLVWSIHHADLGSEDKKLTVFLARSAALLSWIPDRILFASRESLQVHARLGYKKNRLQYIPNGYDTSRFSPDPEAGSTARRKWGLGNAPIIGAAGRFHPVKDFRTLLEAAAIYVQENQQTQFVFCGDGLLSSNVELMSWIRRLGLVENVSLLGRIEEMPAFYNAVDIFTMSSISEAFPNVAAEAMACCVPCVVTDVGDLPAIVGGIGEVVPSKDPAGLASGWSSIMGLTQAERDRIGSLSRQRVKELYSLSAMVRSYKNVYRDLV